MSVPEDNKSAGFLQEIIRHGGNVLFGRIIQLGIKFAATVLLARVLGQTGFGSISLALSVFLIGTTVSMMGLNSGVARFLPRYETTEEKAKIISSAGKIILTLSIIVCVTIYLGTYYINLGLRDIDLKAIRTLSLSIPLFSSIKVIWGIFQGEKLSSNFTLTNQIALPLTRFLLLLAVAIFGFGLIGFVYAQAMTYFLVLPVALALLFRDEKSLTKKSLSLDFSKARKLFVFSSPLVLAGAMNMVISQSDTILIGALSTTSGVGIYNVVYPLAMLLFTVQSSIGFIYLPSLSEEDEGSISDETRSDYLYIVLIILVLTYPVFFLFIYNPSMILSTIFGREYAGGSLALSVLAVGFYIRASLGPNNPALKAIGHTKKIMYINVVAAVINIALNFILIQEYGFLGAAVASGITYLLLGFLYSIFLFQSTGIQPLSKKTASVAVLSLISPFLIRFAFRNTALYDSIVGNILIIIMCVLSYLFALNTFNIFNITKLLDDFRSLE